MLNRNKFYKTSNFKKLVHSHRGWLVCSAILLAAVGLGTSAQGAHAGNITNRSTTPSTIRDVTGQDLSYNPIHITHKDIDYSKGYGNVDQDQSKLKADLSQEAPKSAPVQNANSNTVPQETASGSEAKPSDFRPTQIPSSQPRVNFMGDEPSDNNNRANETQMLAGITSNLKILTDQDTQDAQNYIHQNGLNITGLRTQPLTSTTDLGTLGNLDKFAATYATQLLTNKRAPSIPKLYDQLHMNKQPVHINSVLIHPDKSGNLMIDTPGNMQELNVTDTAQGIATGANNEFMEFDDTPNWNSRFGILDPNDTAIGIGIGYTPAKNTYMVVEAITHKPETEQQKQQIAQASIDSLSNKTFSLANMATGHQAGNVAFTKALHNGESKADAEKAGSQAQQAYENKCLKQTPFKSLLTPQRIQEANEYYKDNVSPDLQSLNQWLSPIQSSVENLHSNPSTPITPHDSQLTNTMLGQYGQDAATEFLNDINNLRKQRGLNTLKPSLEIQTVADMRMPQALDSYEFEDRYYGWRSVHTDSNGVAYAKDNAKALGLNKLFNNVPTGEIAGEGGMGRHQVNNPGYPEPSFDVENGKEMGDEMFTGMTKYDQSQGDGHLKVMIGPSYTHVGVAFYYAPHLKRFVGVADFNGSPSDNPDLSNPVSSSNPTPSPKPAPAPNPSQNTNKEAAPIQFVYKDPEGQVVGTLELSNLGHIGQVVNIEPQISAHMPVGFHLPNSNPIDITLQNAAVSTSLKGTFGNQQTREAAPVVLRYRNNSGQIVGYTQPIAHLGKVGQTVNIEPELARYMPTGYHLASTEPYNYKLTNDGFITIDI